MTKTKNRQTDKEQKYQRMEEVYVFKFDCYPGVSCFTQCCQNVNIVLTPYDVMRMKNALKISSDQFLDQYTMIIPKEKKILPIVLLQMTEDGKKCPFVTSAGCKLYENRPWPCRMYPLDLNDDGTYRIITDPARCLGLKEAKERKIIDWLTYQGLSVYEDMNLLFSSITVPLQSHEPEVENPAISQMVLMALYNLDKFKDFIFKSSFLDRFEIEPERIEKIKNDDEELLRFSFDWVKFGVFGEKLFWVKDKK